MRALILAAGEGSRLRPLTEQLPKCLVPLRGRPLLAYQLEALGACGLDDVAIVTGYRHEALCGWPLRAYHNPRWSETNMVWSLFCAEREFDDDLVIAYGDIVYEPRVLAALLAEPADFAVAVDVGWRELWSLRMDDPLADAETLRCDARGDLVEIGKRPRSPAEIEAQYLGLLRLSREALERLASLWRGLDSRALYDGRSYAQMFMTSLLQQAIDRGTAIRAVRVRHGWLEVDTPADLERYGALRPEHAHLFDFAAFSRVSAPHGGST